MSEGQFNHLVYRIICYQNENQGNSHGKCCKCIIACDAGIPQNRTNQVAVLEHDSACLPFTDGLPARDLPPAAAEEVAALVFVIFGNLTRLTLAASAARRASVCFFCCSCFYAWKKVILCYYKSGRIIGSVGVISIQTKSRHLKAQHQRFNKSES